jgi:hypothetical protein
MKELSMAEDGSGTGAQRLTRVEQAVESIALEIERIGEGQCYVTTLLHGRANTLVDGLPVDNLQADTPALR